MPSDFTVCISYLCYESVKLAFILLFLDSATYHKAVDGGKLTDIYKHFRKQLKQFLHHSGHVTCVSEDPEQFKQVVAAFDVYERQVSHMENNFVEIKTFLLGKTGMVPIFLQ